MKQVLLNLPHLKPTFVLYLEGEEEVADLSVMRTLEHSGLRLLKIQSQSEVKAWLTMQIEHQHTHDQSFVLLCDYNSLKSTNFQLLKDVQAQKSLQSIPFFVHIEKGMSIDKKALLKLGVDDCLETPLDWQNVEQRAAFWIRYKAQIRQAPAHSVQAKKGENLTSTLKRIFDLVVASVLLLCLSPLFLVLAILVKLDSKGPVFYKSKRVGAGYQNFDFWKFRSMYQDADARLEKLLHLNQYEGSNASNCFVKLKNDPRITRIGSIIRKTSLDELPQLFNVLRGEMSLVGNRPLPPYEAVMMVDDYRANRFLAPAGLTGLWQVSKRGKSDMSTEERVNLDVDYARQHSFWYDIKLLMKTLPAMVQEENV